MSTKWEYRVLEVANAKTGELESELARAGRDGWELVCTTVFYNYWMTRIVSRMFLKRPG